MHRIGFRSDAHAYLQWENLDVPGHSPEPDVTYLPLFEPYRASDNANIRYTAEFEVARLTGTPDVRAMINALEGELHRAIRDKAREVLSAFMVAKFKAEGTTASKAERDELVGIARTLKGPDRPSRAAELGKTTSVQRWQTFALLTVSFGDYGYSLLFERRDSRWTFVSGLRVGCLERPLVKGCLATVGLLLGLVSILGQAPPGLQVRTSSSLRRFCTPRARSARGGRASRLRLTREIGSQSTCTTFQGSCLCRTGASL